MSTARTLARRKRSHQAITPMIGWLLRLPHEVIVSRILAALNGKGFDISPTELGVFLYPGPEGRRPIELARQCQMTRQAMNYVLAGLEGRGYIERHTGPTPAARVVRMTDRGWAMVAPIRDCVAAIEHEWTAHLGTRRFNALRETLRDLSLWLGKLG
ncbi:MAG TPA: MarR family transcriptional regulator [Casimicrobiaceae bacterium]|nr:MarR family transcriptional regulator [Casimicrobiaceae bacterium]